MKRTPDNKSLEQSAVWAVTRLETSVVRLPESYGSARLLNSMLGFLGRAEWGLVKVKC